ncbi:unnamed protein product [Phytomonas sp. EM1]|nr:unnamed protein product [Phytomonas sp. EM1]|eukprot:CCW62465.1 unnamed protein product [Phytomonas sp. isolate EM1]
MKITVDVELQEMELARGSRVQQALECINPNVYIRMVTDKISLSARIKEAMADKKYEQITAEIFERLSFTPVFDDCLDILCSDVFFSTQRFEDGNSLQPFIAVICRLPDPAKEKVKNELSQRIMSFLSKPQRLDCSRRPLLPYAETLAAMTKSELLSLRSVVMTIVQMIRLDVTRTAGITCLGKLVEVAYEPLRQCDSQTLELLRTTVATAQRDDSFLYDVEYIMDAFGWSQNKPVLSMVRSSAHHSHLILSLAYCGGTNYREAVVTSSVDGTIGTWDRTGTLTENIVLARHYAASLDLANRGRTLIVGMVCANPSIPPAVVLYSEEGSSRESHWEESGAVEPKSARFITCVRSLRNAGTVRFGVGVSTPTSNPLLLYDRTQLVQEYHDHSDILTAMHVPSDRDTTIITGSRDRSIIIYDVRTRQSVSSVTHHYSSVSAIGTCGDYIFTGGLDRRIVFDDMRMLGHPLVRDMDSAVLSLSINNSMQCAVSTLTGIYLISFSNGGHIPATSRADNGPNATSYHAISWNSTGNVLYAAGESMSLDIFARAYTDGDAFEGT